MGMIDGSIINLWQTKPGLMPNMSVGVQACLLPQETPLNLFGFSARDYARFIRTSVL
ncbi:DUF4424 domain-containing protein [Sesbania bispinosa]|nr:DUF4424 domain-containing protein [Sesbania bispinosa]